MLDSFMSDVGVRKAPSNEGRCLSDCHPGFVPANRHYPRGFSGGSRPTRRGICRESQTHLNPPPFLPRPQPRTATKSRMKRLAAFKPSAVIQLRVMCRNEFHRGSQPRAAGLFRLQLSPFLSPRSLRAFSMKSREGSKLSRQTCKIRSIRTPQTRSDRFHDGRVEDPRPTANVSMD